MATALQRQPCLVAPLYLLSARILPVAGSIQQEYEMRDENERIGNVTNHGISMDTPTPSIYTTQQMGLGITTAFSAHIKNAIKSMHAPRQHHERDSADSFSIGSTRV